MSSKQNTPVHIGFILDGNRRWAKEQGLPTLQGHKKGYENLKTLAEHAFKNGVKYVSAFCFSTENWNRSKEEVGYLMNLTRSVIRRDAKKLSAEGIRIIIMGEQEGLPEDIIEDGRTLVEESKDNQKGTLIICFNYGGMHEIAAAVRKIIGKGIPEAEVTPDLIAQNLYFPDVPPVDLLIRTSGEQRISNFMLWRAAYAELYFIKEYWPDFSIGDLDQALVEYSKRNRRFGGN